MRETGLIHSFITVINQTHFLRLSLDTSQADGFAVDVFLLSIS